MNRIVLSRKGSDATAGGFPSPVLPDGRLAMVPIPEDGSGVTAGELRVGGHALADLAAALGVRRVRTGRGRRPLTPATEVHADPDLDPAALPRPPGWRPLSGPAERSGSRLSLASSDAVLASVMRASAPRRRISASPAGSARPTCSEFWGWYRHTARTGAGLAWTGEPTGFHALHGWLEVGEVVPVSAATDLPWAARHPHLVRRDRPANVLYVAARAGTFTWGEGLRLTAPGSRLRSRWRVPAALHPPRHRQRGPTTATGAAWRRDGDGVELAVVHQGQEFVVSATGALVDWPRALINRHAVRDRPAGA